MVEVRRIKVMKMNNQSFNQVLRCNDLVGHSDPIRNPGQCVYQEVEAQGVCLIYTDPCLICKHLDVYAKIT